MSHGYNTKFAILQMITISTYKHKLGILKKRMLAIHQRTQGIKRRALFIKDVKTRELEEKSRLQREEEQLICDNVNKSK